MQKTNDILQWYFKPNDLRYTAEHLFSENTKQQVKESLISLNNLIDRLPDGGKLPEKKLIRDVYYLFFRNFQEPAFSFSKRDIRILIWALDFQPNSDSEIILFSNKFETAVNLINQNWRDSFIVSLWHVLLKNWQPLLSYDKHRNLLTNILEEKCKRYNKNRNDILKISTSIDLFLPKNSPEQYATLLLDNNISLSKAYLLINLKEHILNYDYFAYVANNYVDKSENKNVDAELIAGIYLFLEKHNSKKTSMLICSQIINQDKFTNNVEIIKKETVKLIGDPVKIHEWRNSKLKSEEQQQVEQARKKLNILLNKHFIKVFFERLVQDERRKRYWLKFIDKIDDIKFSGNKANYRYLKNIESVSKYVDYRYKITSRNQSTCALIIYSKDFVFVEFTDTGALYIYKKQSFNVNLNALDSMEDLKTWSRYKYACKNSDYSGYIDLDIEGRITHQGYWESRFDAWMRKYYYD
ncbi:MAG: EH signature domain-containing protein [Bacteroidales bacterium]|nr:EH signature domain-containing protein [Bacteroidales bacterium]MDD3962430.1 EH signature domain-containing protein [Bacteroidales bacterium]